MESLTQKMIKCLCPILCLFLLAGCGEDNDKGTGDEIRLAKGTSTSQTIYADETSLNQEEGIRFTTSGPWRAEVEELAITKASSADWITLSQTGGDKAGDYTLKITVGVNHTGKDRKAVIRIICGETVITITVEQKALTEEGKEPEPDKPDTNKYTSFVSNITFTPAYWDEYKSGYHPGKETYDFNYDDQNRIIGYEIQTYKVNGSLEDNITTDLDYSGADNIRITERRKDTEQETYTVFLNEKGYVKQVKRTSSINTPVIYNVSYNADNRLTKWSWEYSDQEYWYSIAYEGRVPTTLTAYGRGETDVTYGQEYFFGTIPNDKLNIDINMLFTVLGGGDHFSEDLEEDFYGMISGRMTRLALLRLTGKIADYYVEKREGDGWADADDVAPTHDKPNVTVHREFTRWRFDSGNILHYTFNDDGSVAAITYEDTVIKLKYEYDLVVGSEKIDEWAVPPIYKGEKKNEKTTEVGSGKNVYTYKFTYK